MITQINEKQCWEAWNFSYVPLLPGLSWVTVSGTSIGYTRLIPTFKIVQINSINRTYLQPQIFILDEAMLAQKPFWAVYHDKCTLSIPSLARQMRKIGVFRRLWLLFRKLEYAELPEKAPFNAN
jgi:hypothetical protein